MGYSPWGHKELATAERLHFPLRKEQKKQMWKQVQGTVLNAVSSPSSSCKLIPKWTQNCRKVCFLIIAVCQMHSHHHSDLCSSLELTESFFFNELQSQHNSVNLGLKPDHLSLILVPLSVHQYLKIVVGN